MTDTISVLIGKLLVLLFHSQDVHANVKFPQDLPKLPELLCVYRLKSYHSLPRNVLVHVLNLCPLVSWSVILESIQVYIP